MKLASLGLPTVLAGVAAGTLAADAVAPPLGPIGALGAIFVALGLAAGRAGMGLVGVALLSVVVGAWRGQPTEPTAAVTASVAALADGSDHDLIGTVMDDPRPREDRLQLVLGDLSFLRDGAAHRLSDRLLVWLPRGIDAASGDRLLIGSRVELAEDFDGFAYREYLARHGIGAIARAARSAEVVAAGNGPAVAMAAIRSALLGGLNDLVPEPEAALGAGILLGVRSAIAPEINDAFSTAGLTHVVAISGWNIAIVAALVAAAVRPLAKRPGGRWTTAAVAAATVGGYVVVTGASPSVVRAALMAGAMLVARLGGSRAHAASALALAALVMLLAAPPVLWDVGFQLSLLATGGLIWFGAPIEGRLTRWPAWIREPVALTLAAQLTTLPVILVNFERLSLVAPIANVLVVPFVPLAMLFSAVAAAVGLIDGLIHVPLIGNALTWLAGGAAWLVLRVIVWLGTTVASVPNAAVDIRVPPAVAIAWLPMLALAEWAVRDRTLPQKPTPVERPPSEPVRRFVRPVPICGAMVGVLLAITVAARPDGLLHLTVLDVGQGDAILVETPDGATMLIDGGPDPELTLRRMGTNLPFFARRIDLLVLSHPHQDHVAGLVEVLDRFRVGAVMHAGIPFHNPAYDRLLTDAGNAGVPVQPLRAGQTFALGRSTALEVLYPTEADATAPLPEGDINNGSVVLLLRIGAFAALMTGDAEEPVETALVVRSLVPPVDVLKVGHHGSTSSTTSALLAAAHPSVAVISSGEGNEYGHPAPETLGALAAVADLATYRTDTLGDVEIVTDGRTFRVRTDAGWTAARPVRAAMGAGSIGPWPFPTDPPPVACWPTRGCRTGSSSTPRAWPASPWPLPAWWPRHRSRLTARWSRPPLCSTTSTSSRSGAAAASTASSAPGGSRRWVTRSSRCRSPPIPSPRCSTTIAFRSAGPRCWWPWPTATWARRS